MELITHAVTVGSGSLEGCVCVCVFLPCLARLGTDLCIHLMFLVDKSANKQMQNSHYAQISPQYIKHGWNKYVFLKQALHSRTDYNVNIVFSNACFSVQITNRYPHIHSILFSP